MYLLFVPYYIQQRLFNVRDQKASVLESIEFCKYDDAIHS